MILTKVNNNKITLRQRPEGIVKKEDFDFLTEEVRDIEDGELLIKVKYISCDPAMRGWMNEGTTYMPGVKIGEVMRGFAAGEIIESKNSEFKKGHYVTGLLGVQEYVISDGKGLSYIEQLDSPLSSHLGILGMPGMTAYFGLLEKGKPEAGQTVFVSGAAGVVGSTVGQIAKIKGCKVVGTAGSDAKCKYLIDDCRFDAVINYKTEDVASRIKELCPDGIDVFYDNVGGPLLDTVLTQLARGARIVICGAISQYNKKEIYGPKNYMKIVTARGCMTGIIVFDYIHEYPKAVKVISQWISEGKLRYKEDIHHGLDNFPTVLKKLFSGENFGKLIVAI